MQKQQDARCFWEITGKLMKSSLVGKKGGRRVAFKRCWLFAAAKIKFTHVRELSTMLSL
jgi:hypothetical protein